MKTIPLYFLAMIMLSSCQESKKISFTFDDLPVVAELEIDSTTYVQTFKTLAGKLKENKIPAIGFINEGWLYEGDVLVPYRLELLKYWADLGLQLGNHTFSHIDYHEISLSEFAEEVDKGANLTKDLMTLESGYKYLRHPFLHTGQTKERADSLAKYLEEQGYKEAPVTLLHEDYFFSYAYEIAMKQQNETLKQEIMNAYLDNMEKKIVYYENLSKNVFGRHINQILLMHNNQLNAAVIQDVIDLFKAHSYQFISLLEALEDPAYKTEITIHDEWGNSWLDRWALSLNKGVEYLKNNPPTPKFIYELIGN